MNFKPLNKSIVVTDNIIKMSKSLMCVRAQYTVEEKFEIPEWIDLDDKKQVISYEVEGHILTIKTVDCEIKILPLDGGCVVYNPYPCEVMYEPDDEANDAREEGGDLFTSIIKQACPEYEPKVEPVVPDLFGELMKEANEEEKPKKKRVITKKKLLVVEDDEDDAVNFATLDNPYLDKEIEEDSDRVRMNEAVDKIVEYMKINEFKDFFGNLSSADLCYEDAFKAELNRHIYSSVLMLENRGNLMLFNDAVDSVWGHNREYDDDEFDNDDDHFRCYRCKEVKDADEQHTDDGLCGDCVTDADL